MDAAFAVGKPMPRNATCVFLLLNLCLLAGCARDRSRFATTTDVLSCTRKAIWGQLDPSLVSSVSITVDAIDAKQNQLKTEMTFGWRGPTFESRTALPPSSPSPAVLITKCKDGQCEEGLEHQPPPTFSPAVSRNRMKGFAQLAIELFMRDDVLPGMTWAEKPRVDGARLLLDAKDQSEFNLGVAVDPRTCLPVSASYERASNPGDAFSGRSGDRHVNSTELLDYQVFDGLRLPTHLRMRVDGAPDQEWHVTDAHLVRQQGK